MTDSITTNIINVHSLWRQRHTVFPAWDNSQHQCTAAPKPSPLVEAFAVYYSKPADVPHTPYGRQSRLAFPEPTMKAHDMCLPHKVAAKCTVNETFFSSDPNPISNQ